MKKLKLPKSLLVTVAAPALLTLAVPAGHVLAQGQTETKIRLMADALRARDSGDLETAKKNLEELLALAPNDATVQRLLTGVNASIAARTSGTPVVESAPAPTSSEPVEVSLDAASKAASAPVQTPEEAALAQAEDLAKQENERIKGLIAEARVKRTEARRLAKDGRFDEAAAVFDSAINSLPANPATAETIADLQAEKNGLLLEKAQYALKQGDTVGARAALDAYALVSTNDRKADRIARSVNETELNPPLQPIEKVNPKFIADQKEIAKLEAKGRSQYLAGDLDGAQETFRTIESIDTGNPMAKSFLARIATEKAAVGELNRIKTRTQMMEEVGNSWQRPGVYVDRGGDPTRPTGTPALAQKLNNIQIPSVNFSGVELSRVISTLSAISPEYDKSEGASGVNIVLIDTTNKNPMVNITLRNLSLKRILDLVTDATGYQYEVQDDTVVVRPGGEGGGVTLENAFFPVTRATVLRMTGMGAAAATPAASADPFAASTAPAAGGSSAGGESAALQSFLEQAGVRFSTTPGSSLVYDGSAIIVNQSSRNIERIRNILNRYNDVRQVEIETKFMDVQEGVLEELGVQWLTTNGTDIYASGNRTLGEVFSPSGTGSTGLINTNTGAIPLPSAAPTLPGGVNIGNGAGGVPRNLPVQLPLDGGLTADLPVPQGTLAAITGTIGNFDVAAMIRALSQKEGSDLLSAPKVTVLSGNPANIVVAQELRYPQSYGETQSTVSSGNSGGSAIALTAGTPQEFTMRNIGVELKVTPTVEEDDYSISLDLNPKVTEFDGFVEYGGMSVALTSSDDQSSQVLIPSGFYQPIFSTREITTKVTVWDGATLVMGGLTREEVKKVNDKVPLLGDIPFLGRAFRSKGETSSKRNLLIFVTANLVSPGGSPKKQQLKSVAPSSMFQNPTIVTPGSAESRVRDSK
jgi:general secretion pathway protein D